MSLGHPPVPTATDTFGSGFRLGKYEIIVRLAAGGMAEIFLARLSGLPGFQKIVCIKRILPRLAENTDFVEMFLDEARIASTLQHPNIVQVYDVGVVQGNYFIAMEYLHGETVRALTRTATVRGKAAPLDLALNVIVNVCAGLHYAHEKLGFDGEKLQIVHRDVTPQNIILTYEGGVKLLDFGIAKASNRVGETRFGTLKGKIGYMSPEQCRSEPLDRRSDIFSLGIMLYELTLGKRLFQGGSDFEILKQIVESEVTPPHAIDPNYSPALERIVLRALAKSPDNRYQTARELQADLDEFAREERLSVSQLGLQEYMQKIFGPKIEAWRTAQAQGHSLEQYLEGLGPDSFIVEESGESHKRSEHEQRERIRQKAAAIVTSYDSPSTTSGKRKRHISVSPSGDTEVGPSMDSGVSQVRVSSGFEALPTSPSLSVERPARGRIWMVGAAGLLIAVGIFARSRTIHTPPTEPAEPRVSARDTPPAKPTSAVPNELEYPTAEREKVLPPEAEQRVENPQSATDAPSNVPSHSAKAPKSRLRPSPASARVPPTSGPAEQPGQVSAEPEVATPIEKGEGTLVLASSPWCTVSIDGVAHGPTPLTVTLPSGKHSVQLANPEFKIHRTLSVNIHPNETVRKQLEFAQ